MKFMLISYYTKDGEAGAAPDPRLLAAIPRLWKKMPKGGAILGTGGLAPSSMGAKVRVLGGKVLVTDGPFATRSLTSTRWKRQLLSPRNSFSCMSMSWAPPTRVEEKFAQCFTRRNVAHNNSGPADDRQSVDASSERPPMRPGSYP